MSMMIIAKNKDISPWIDSFLQFDKNLDIQIYPNIKIKMILLLLLFGQVMIVILNNIKT